MRIQDGGFREDLQMCHVTNSQHWHSQGIKRAKQNDTALRAKGLSASKDCGSKNENVVKSLWNEDQIFHQLSHVVKDTYSSCEYESFKEVRNSFFGLGVYLLKSKLRIEDKLRFPWYYTTFSKYDQSLFSHGSLATAVTIATVMDNPSF